MSPITSNLETILATAVEISSDAERDAYLKQACAGDSALRQRVDVLVANHFRAGNFLEPVAATATVDGPFRETAGTMIGRYKLLQLIGEGGMGEVWLAEQMEPVRRQVALKLIKPGMDSKRVLARFDAERQALALMDHPNIAKVLDAGAFQTANRRLEAAENPSDSQTPVPSFQAGEGRPYFVMELVKGLPITKYCDEHRLTPRERLELFVPVCQSVQHAHQKGIIHRDLKPSNVLVGIYDGRPVVKIIDFGVAKAAGLRLTEQTLFTEFGAVVGTLEYMSPEQAQLDNLDIDTRSDIYSLGVLLYELLTGTTPLDRARLKRSAFMEVLRIIREEEPPRPSTRLSQLGSPLTERLEPNGNVTRGATATLASISALRQTEPAKLTRVIRGELDWIVMKALDKDRNRRYETANAFAMDLQRYLADEPVQACPPSAGYRFRKFARRNRSALLMVSVIALAVLAGSAISTWQAIRAGNAEELAEGRLVAEREARSALGASRDEKERQERRINRELSEALMDVTQLRGRLGRLGPGATEQWAQLGVSMQRAKTLAEDPLAESALVRRAADLQAEVQQDEINRRMTARLEEICLNKADFNADRVRTISGGSYLAYAEAFNEFGLPVFKLSVDEAARRIAASPIRDVLVAALDDCASNTQELCERLMPIAQRVSNDPWRRKYYEIRMRRDPQALLLLAKQPAALEQPAQTLQTLALLLFAVDRQAATQLLRDWQRRHPGDLWISHRLTEFLINLQGKSREEALRLRVEAVGFARVALAARPHSPALHNSLASALVHSEQLDDAIAVCLRSIEFKANNPFAYVVLGDARRAKGEFDAAVAAYRKAIALDSRFPRAHVRLGEILAQQGEWDAALAAYKTASAIDPNDFGLYLSLGTVLESKKDFDGAIKAFQKIIDIRPKEPRAYLGLGRSLSKKGYKVQAIAAYRKTIDLRPEEPGVYAFLGEALAGMGDFVAAVTAYQRAVEREPSDGNYHALGMALRAAGKLADATAAFREALRIDYDNAQYFRSLAWASLAVGDRPGYLRTCGDMVNWLDNTKEGPVARQILHTCLPVAEAIPDMARLLPLAELAAGEKSNLALLGAAFYRAGKYEAAIKKLEEAASSAPPRAWDQLFRAMVHYRLGHADKAREYLDKATVQTRTAHYDWPESEEVKLLSREAETLLKGNGATPAGRKGQ